MTYFEKVTNKFQNLKYMNEDRANFIRDFMHKNQVENVL